MACHLATPATGKWKLLCCGSETHRLLPGFPLGGLRCRGLLLLRLLLEERLQLQLEERPCQQLHHLLVDVLHTGRLPLHPCGSPDRLGRLAAHLASENSCLQPCLRKGSRCPVNSKYSDTMGVNGSLKRNAVQLESASSVDEAMQLCWWKSVCRNW